MSDALKNFFYPETICVAGASSKELSIGYELLKTIHIYGYKGKVYPVNPKAEEILGYKCYSDIDEIQEKIDLGIVVVPKKFVFETVDKLLAKGVKSVLLVTAGFKETGEEGKKAEQELLRKIKEAGARLVGPNCMGVINALEDTRLNATFVAEKPETGKTGFFSQSGALGAAVLNSLRETGIRFAHFVSAGNKADINENDILTFWGNDNNIKVLTYYLESFENGLGFVKQASATDKPVIVLKAGRSEGGQKAASSHTGALSGSDRVADSVLKQFGVIRAQNIKELFNTAKGFENYNIPAGNGIAVVTNAGGPAILAVDSLEARGLKLAEINEKTKERLREFVHPEGSVNNPVDLLPGGDADSYKKTVETLLEDDNVDAVISIFVEPVMVQPMPVVEGINSILSSKPVLQVVLPLPEFRENYNNNSETRKPYFTEPEEPAAVLSNMLFYKSGIERRKHERISFNPGERKKRDFANGYLSQEEVNELAQEYGLPVPQSKIIDPEEIKEFTGVSFPVVLKGVSKDVLHKSEMQAVKVDIQNHEQLVSEAEAMISRFEDKGYTIEKFLAQQFIKTKHELLIGGYRDPSFGPVIVFGSGGKYVEVYKDTQLRSAYVSEKDIEEIVSGTAAGKILGGVRGESQADLKTLNKIIRSAALMMVENPEVEEFDINPLILGEDGKYYAVDIRIKWNNNF